ncbi:TlyA family RNA methyltransferase [Neomegalonema sp.]|uniref:TlyA family RNA methyltransferase n=1 Tax=Neomegalonema sp. TaxID=2039713 RepID=UPI002611E6F2|nr:TlyA family RNA methyltransferase [Neomegalonema sp.]MDD2869046.1 TlyA family RNA methyltransferase [Neomegalonema sp.]
MRLDQALVARGLAESRARAQALIRDGLARLNGAPVRKAAQEVSESDDLAVEAGGLVWVSRGALKLLAALDGFGFSPEGRTIYDLGASTGGFTEVLLGRGARRVWALDVGHGQLHPRIAADPRVSAREGFNVREMGPEDPPEDPEALTADLSFISLTKALGPALGRARPGAWLAALVKPQFELGPGRVGKGGILKEEAAGEEALALVAEFLEAEGWRVVGTMESPIPGGDGNRERLLGAVKGA